MCMSRDQQLNKTGSSTNETSKSKEKFSNLRIKTEPIQQSTRRLSTRSDMSNLSSTSNSNYLAVPKKSMPAKTQSLLELPSNKSLEPHIRKTNSARGTPSASPTNSNSLAVPNRSNLVRSRSAEFSNMSVGNSSPRTEKSFDKCSVDYDPKHPEYNSKRYTRTTHEHVTPVGKKHVTAAYRISKHHIILETSFR